MGTVHEGGVGFRKWTALSGPDGAGGGLAWRHCTMATVTWLRAHGQLADALTKPGRDTPLQQTIGSGAYAVRLAATDYLTKRSSAAPDQDGVTENYYDDEADRTPPRATTTTVTTKTTLKKAPARRTRTNTSKGECE